MVNLLHPDTTPIHLCIRAPSSVHILVLEQLPVDPTKHFDFLYITLLLSCRIIQSF